MASIRDLYKDPFENYSLLMQKLNRVAFIGEATSAVLKTSRASSISNVDYLNSMNSALGILQQRMDSFAGADVNLFSAMDTVAQRLSEFNKFQPQIMSALERVCQYDNRLMSALQGSYSLISGIDTIFEEDSSRFSVADALEQIDNLQILIYNIVDKGEKSEIQYCDNSSVVEVTKTPIKINTKVIIIYLVLIVRLLFNNILSDIPEIDLEITNDRSTNYYIQEVNNYYIQTDEIDTNKLNLNKYRFISEKEVVVRVKADCSSYIVEKLKLGKVVQIVDKYKKWVQICWKNEDDTYSYGWIQNYKLSEFKE